LRDVPCVPQSSDAQIRNIRTQLKAKSYPCVERGEIVWTYMGPAELKPEFPIRSGRACRRRNATRPGTFRNAIGFRASKGGFDATHLTFLHGGDAEASRRIVPVHY
jgi:phenylpropionate dioxygenase-like ring-hydroxylating dioxygenase large terminal subunit